MSQVREPRSYSVVEWRSFNSDPQICSPIYGYWSWGGQWIRNSWFGGWGRGMGSRFVTILWAGLLLLIDTNPENFFDDRNLDHSTHVSWRDLPDREDGLGELLTGILERSRRAAQRHAPTTDDNNTPMNYTATLVAEVARAPGPHDYPLWRVRCRVSWLRLALTKNLSNHPVRHGTRTRFFSYANCAAPSPVAVCLHA